MSWQFWVVVAFSLFGVIVAPVNIGKPREPRTQQMAIVEICIHLTIIILIIWGAQ